jgi:hypothetical protein
VFVTNCGSAGKSRNKNHIYFVYHIRPLPRPHLGRTCHVHRVGLAGQALKNFNRKPTPPTQYIKGSIGSLTLCCGIGTIILLLTSTRASVIRFSTAMKVRRSGRCLSCTLYALDFVRTMPRCQRAAMTVFPFLFLSDSTRQMQEY